MDLDPRLHAYRPDLADSSLEGRVASERFAEGDSFVVVTPTAPLRRAPSRDAALDTEALAGETVRVFEVADGWAWCQLDTDRYVGWMPGNCLAEAGAAPTHRVSALRTLVFARPDIKTPPLMGLPMGARVRVTGEAEDRNARYALVEPAGAIVVQHLTPAGEIETDFAGVAERFAGAPYLWGGKTSLGVDCSGLVQVVLAACGIAAPRDTDMQEAAVGSALPIANGLPPLKRGDLVFWKGHVGIMRDAETLLHANAFHMAVASEPLAETIRRYEAKGVPVTSIRRIQPVPATAGL